MVTDPFEDFLDTLRLATNETQMREAFIALTATAFADTQLARDLALGAEYQVKFQQSGAIRRGQIDSFYGNLVIEFEFDLDATEVHALDQLRGYVAGAWTEDGNANRPYLAVASDGRRWMVLTPHLVEPGQPIAADNVALELNEVLVVDPGQGGQLQTFLNRLFFRKWLLKPTAANFTRDFGLASPAFVRSGKGLLTKLGELADDPQLDLLKTEWDASLREAYGGSVASDELFVRHTYLAGLARLLVFVALEQRPITDAEVNLVLDGDYFRGRQITNITEDDFFFWHRIPSATNARRIWVAISHQLAGYDLAGVEEDVIKPLYESLVDPEFRHDLGEYYTPDWLATRVVKRLLEPWSWDNGMPSVIDPACGSGTFLRAVIAEIRDHLGAGPELVETILRSVVGVDVHPLAVIIARATYLLAIADLLDGVSHSIAIPVYLSNSLQTADMVEEQNLWDESEIRLVVGEGGEWRKSFPLPVGFVRSVASFDGAIDAVVEVAEGYAYSDDNPGNARNVIKRRLAKSLSQWPDAVAQLGAMTVHLVGLIRARQDGVWGFLLRNRYRPTMLGGSFDFAVGNPPWLTVGAIDSEAYKESVLKLALAAGIAPRAAGEQAHTELATLFLPQAYRLFLRQNPRKPYANVAFVMPRSLMNASHHRLVREGKYRAAFGVSELWDLDQVRPLFNVPSCVLFCADKVPTPNSPFSGVVFDGTLPEKDAPEDIVAKRIRSRECKFRLAHLARRTAWVEDDGLGGQDSAAPPPSAYVQRFRQGAIIYPQVLFAVVPASGTISRAVEQVRVVTDPRASASAKLLKTVSVNHLVDCASCLCTLAAENLMPWGVRGAPWAVVLPTTCDPDSDQFRPATPSELRSAGRLRTAKWLEWANSQWSSARKQGEKADLWDRLDYMGQFSGQAGRGRYIVLYTSSGSRVFAAVFDADTLALPFVARDKTYWASFAHPAEAHYVCAFLNSDFGFHCVEDFMTRGLFGTRDTHKRILDVPFPVFNKNNDRHIELAIMGRSLVASASGIIEKLPATTSTGNARTAVRDHIDHASWSRAEVLIAQLSTEHGAISAKFKK